MNTTSSKYKVDYAPLDFNLLISTGTWGELVSGVKHDDVEYEDILEALVKHPFLVQAGIDGELAGFFSVDDLGKPLGRSTVEIHAYLFPHMRRFSIALLKDFKEWLFEVGQFETIVTSVPDKYPHIQRLMGMLGFKELTRQEDALKFDGISYGMTYFYCSK